MSQRKGSGVQRVLVNICYKKPGNKHSTLRGTHVLSVTNYFSFFVQHLKKYKSHSYLEDCTKEITGQIWLEGHSSHSSERRKKEQRA